MPEPRSRQGITENAGGRVICPVCRSDTLTVAVVAYGGARVSVIVNQDHGTFTSELVPRQAQYLHLEAFCANGHGFALELDISPVDGEAVAHRHLRWSTEWEVETGDDRDG